MTTNPETIRLADAANELDVPATELLRAIDAAGEAPHRGRDGWPHITRTQLEQLRKTLQR